MMKKIKKKKRVRAHTQPPLFARLAYTSPGKKCDEQLTHIVRVSSCNYIVLSQDVAEIIFILLNMRIDHFQFVEK
jgi:hypothetical protein